MSRFCCFFFLIPTREDSNHFRNIDKLHKNKWINKFFKKGNNYWTQHCTIFMREKRQIGLTREEDIWEREREKAVTAIAVNKKKKKKKKE